MTSTTSDMEGGGEDWTKEPEEAEKEPSPILQEDELQSQPKSYCLHRFLAFVKYSTAFAAFNMGLGQLIGIGYSADGPVQYVIRAYVVLLCVLVFFNEMQWTKYTRDSTLLRVWITRGLIYTFVGVLGLQENTVFPEQDPDSNLAAVPVLLYLEGVAWLMVVIGMLYALMGLFCVQIVDTRLRMKLEQKNEQPKETDTLVFGGESA